MTFLNEIPRCRPTVAAVIRRSADWLAGCMQGRHSDLASVSLTIY